MGKIKVSFTEKLMLNQLMPTEDSHMNLVVRRDLLKKIGLSQKDFKDNEYKVVGNNSVWDDKGKDASVEFSEPEKTYLKEKLVKIETEKKLSHLLLDFYDKIM